MLKIQRQKIILLIDSSGSMKGQPLEDIKKASQKLFNTLNEYQKKGILCSLHIISFNDNAKFVSKHSIKKMRAEGRTNLAGTYKKLGLLYKGDIKYAKPPIVILLCDGCPNEGDYTTELNKLKKNKEFKNSIKIAFAYRTQDKQTMKVLTDFTGNPSNVFKEDSSKLINYVISNSIPKIIKNNPKRKTNNKTVVKIFTDDIKLVKGKVH